MTAVPLQPGWSGTESANVLLTEFEEFRASVQAHLDPENARALQNVEQSLLIAEDDIAIVLLVFIAFVVVVPVVARADEAISRKTIQLLVRQLDQRQIDQAIARRDLHDE